MATKKAFLMHPGQILREEFLEPFGITPDALAKALRVPRMRIMEILRGQGRVNAEIALRLGRFLEMTPEFWVNLQAHYDLEEERYRSGFRIENEVKPWSVQMDDEPTSDDLEETADFNSGYMQPA